LAPHLYFRGGSTYGAVDLTDGCWFLREDGNCRIETDFGRSLKPSTCRLFPFNRIFRVRDVRVVDINSVLCPLQLVDGGGVTWTELEREMAELAGSPLLDVPATEPIGLPDDWLSCERRIYDAARAHPDDPDALARASGAPDAAVLAAAWGRVYGVSDEERRRLEGLAAPNVALLAPSLRWNTLFRKDAGDYPTAAERLPRRVRALGFLAAMATRARGTPPSIRGLTELWQMQTRTLDVLTNWNQDVRLAQPTFEGDVSDEFTAAFGVLIGGAFRGGRTLGELLNAAADTVDGALRPLVVPLAAAHWATLFPCGV
jgi:hypothetical protein